MTIKYKFGAGAEVGAEVGDGGGTRYPGMETNGLLLLLLPLGMSTNILWSLSASIFAYTRGNLYCFLCKNG